MGNLTQTLSDTETKAWIYNGRWVADCPRNDCANVELADSVNDIFRCSNCGKTAWIEFPENHSQLMNILWERPIPQSRNWFYPDQPLAIKANLPHGQTVDDLIAENREHGVL